MTMYWICTRPRGGEDAFIGVGVNGESRAELTMECAKACFPRSVSLSITYWQFSNYEKSLLSAELDLDEWDKDFERRDYEFSFSMVPLSYIGLIIAFAFSIDIFIVLFIGSWWYLNFDFSCILS